MIRLILLSAVLTCSLSRGQLCDDVTYRPDNKLQGDITMTTTATDLMTCRDRCLEEGACVGLNHNRKTGKCQLFSSITGATPDKGVTSLSCGARAKTASKGDADNAENQGEQQEVASEPGCLTVVVTEGVQHQGGLLESVGARGVEECQGSCFRDPDCEGATYNSVTYTCHKFRYIEYQSWDADSTSVSCADDNSIHHRVKREANETTTEAASNTTSDTTTPEPDSNTTSAATTPEPDSNTTSAATTPEPDSNTTSDTTPEPDSNTTSAATTPEPDSNTTSTATTPEPDSNTTSAATTPEPDSNTSATTTPRADSSTTSATTTPGADSSTTSATITKEASSTTSATTTQKASNTTTPEADTTSAATTTEAPETTTSVLTSIEGFQGMESKGVSGVEIPVSRRKRALNGANLQQCAAQCNNLPGCVAFVATPDGDGTYTCRFYSQATFFIVQTDSITFINIILTGEIFFAVVDDCLVEAGLTRDIVKKIPTMEWRTRWQTCRSYPTAMTCMMRNFDKCLDVPAFAAGAWDVIDQFYRDCYVWSHPGYCPSVEPDCSAAVSAKSGPEGSPINTTQCRYTSYSGSYDDGVVTRTWEYEWGYDRDCPQLHKCCNGANGYGTCVRADPPEEGCDVHQATQCRANIFTRDTVFVNRQQFCADYVVKFKDCFTGHIEKCSDETLARFDREWGFRWQLRVLVNTLATCDYDPCDPDPCNGNGKCINLYDKALTLADEEQSLWEAAAREWSIKQAWRCECYQYYRGVQCEIPECPSYEVSVGLPSLGFLGGMYDLGTLPGAYGVGYMSRSSLYFIIILPGGGITFYMVTPTAVVVLVVLNNLFSVTFVMAGLGLNIVGTYCPFQRACADGRGYLYEYGWHLEDKTFLGNPVIQQQFALSTPVRIGCNSFTQICVSIDGFVTFTNGVCPPAVVAQHALFPPYYFLPDDPQFSVFGSIQTVLQFTGGRVYFGEHYTAAGTNILRATSDMQAMGFPDFKARQVVVVTWHRVTPTMASILGGSPTNTYQMVVISDFASTHVFFYHDDMWVRTKSYVELGALRPLQMGRKFFTATGADSYDVTADSAGSSKAKYIVEKGNKQHASSGQSFWGWDATDATCPVTMSPCQRWILNNATDTFEHDTCLADVCPSDEIFAISSGFRCMNPSAYGNSEKRTCYTSWRWIWNKKSWKSGLTRYARSICCYTKSALACASGSNDLLAALENPGAAGSLITTMDGAGYTEYMDRYKTTVKYSYSYTSGGRSYSYSGSYTSYRYRSYDMNGWETCCNDANRAEGDCELFYNFRRIATSRCFVPRFLRLLRGDPHFTTSDDKTYTFNGHGEYVLVKTRDDDVQIQVRTTRLALADGTLVNATKFSAMALYQKESQIIQVQLKDPLDADTTLDMFADGVPIVPQGDGEDLTFGKATISIFSDKSVRILLDGGWSVNVQVSRGLMMFAVAIPDNMWGNTVGLLGTFNNDTSDDFERPDGTTLLEDSDPMDIHWNFGQKWATTKESSVFTYFGPDTWDTFSEPGFVPHFPTEPDQDTKDLCGDDEQCIFDYQVTGDRGIALDTAKANANIKRHAEILANNPPTLSVQNGTSVTLKAGASAYLLVDVADADGDVVTLEKSTAYRTGCLTISDTPTPTTKKVTINTGNLMECDIALIVRDEHKIGSGVTQVTIVECPDCDHGSCDHATAQRKPGAAGNYYKSAMCGCDLGWKGTTCDERVDFCNPNPCGDRRCKGLSDEELAAANNNNTRGYECKCGFEEVSIAGNCFAQIVNGSLAVPTEAPEDDGLSKEFLTVIIVCAVVAALGLALVGVVIASQKMAAARAPQKMPDRSYSPRKTSYAPRMNMMPVTSHGWNSAYPRTMQPNQMQPQYPVYQSVYSQATYMAPSGGYAPPGGYPRAVLRR